MKNRTLLLPLLIALVMSACAPISSLVEETPVPVVTQEPLPASTQTESVPQPDLPISTAWKAVRDPGYGFGLALPCWFQVSPIPGQGYGGVMTITNYDEAYFLSHSTKGFWEWPNGTLKMDVIIMESADPAKSDADAYMEFVDPTMTGLVSVESQQIGPHTVSVLTLSNLVNTADPDTRIFIFRPAPNRLLMVAPTPQEIIQTPDFQAILGSITLTSNEQIVLPTVAPAPPLIDGSCAG